MLWLVECRRTHCDRIAKLFSQTRCDGPVDSVGIDLRDLGFVSLVNEFVPDRDVRGHASLHLGRIGERDCTRFERNAAF